MADKTDNIREAAEGSLLTFIRLLAPHRVLGAVHEEVISWWTREEAGDHQLLLMPRDHQKSAMIAYRVAWELTKDPCATFLYISSTAGLAERQLYFIKNILTSKAYARYWPEMVNQEAGKRERWTTSEIIVDHPRRKKEGVRDASIQTAGLTTSLTGFHFSHAILDDVVVRENAYTEEGRNKVREQYSLLASIESTGSREWVVGTRYHPKDLYNDLIEMEKEVYSSEGEIVDKLPVYEVMQREVEDRGDGTGEFLWPRQQRHDGKWYGFDASVLSTKRAKYLDKTQYRAQYYNNPNDPTGSMVTDNKFQYYEKKHLENTDGIWYYKEKRLNVFAAIDFAFSLSKRADSTAIVVVGAASDGSLYVLEIDRFKTDGRISVYFEHILAVHTRWGFRKLRAETTVAQVAIARELRDSYIKPMGIALSIDENHPSRAAGSKEERISSILEPRYDNLSIWHYKGGNCQLLEEELRMAHPPHDDIKDALAAAIEIAVPPRHNNNRDKKKRAVLVNTRFGGVAYA